MPGKRNTDKTYNVEIERYLTSDKNRIAICKGFNLLNSQFAKIRDRITILNQLGYRLEIGTIKQNMVLHKRWYYINMINEVAPVFPTYKIVRGIDVMIYSGSCCNQPFYHATDSRWESVEYENGITSKLFNNI